uniref:AP complex mu/sigma subunit domain-containing protein n=1 Tax=Castor canadensis TaxID=51338 RepID=A0A8C0WID2_CASCN
MIQAILVFNNHGKPRLVRFYQRFPEEIQQQIVRETFHLVLKRDDNICNFLEGGSLIGGSDYKLIYRHYATLYFVFCVDSSESELGILDLIQVFCGSSWTRLLSTRMSSETQLLNAKPDWRPRSSSRRDIRPARTSGSSRSFGFGCILFPSLKKKRKEKKRKESDK